MEALEQEEYLEELGRKLNGDYSTEVAIESSEGNPDETEFSSNTDPFVPSVLPAFLLKPRSTFKRAQPRSYEIPIQSNRNRGGRNLLLKDPVSRSH